MKTPKQVRIAASHGSTKQEFPPPSRSGTQLIAAPWPGSSLTGRTGHGGLPVRAADGVSATTPAVSEHAGIGTASAAPDQLLAVKP